MNLGLMAKAVTKLETFVVNKMTQQQVVVILTAVSEGSKLTELEISDSNLAGVDPVLLAKAVTKLETLKVTYTKLTQQQAVAILTAVSEGSKLTKLDISNNNLSGIDPGLLAKAVTKLETFKARDTNLRQQQTVAILTAVSEGSKLTKLDIDEPMEDEDVDEDTESDESNEEYLWARRRAYIPSYML